MIDETKQDLLVQYLLGELDPAMADKVRAELARDVELQKFAHEMEEAFASMAYAAPPKIPPVDLAQRILQAERGTPRRDSPPTSRPKIIWLAVPWALAAAFAIACAVLGLEEVRLRKDLLSLQEKVMDANKAYAVLQQKNTQSERDLAAQKERNLLSELRIATLRAQIATYKGATAVVVWDKDKRNGVLQLDKLPPPAPGKDYQLWVIDPKNPQPVSAGILSVPNDGLIRTSFHPASPVESADAFAISVEKAGGAPKPEGQIILVGK